MRTALAYMYAVAVQISSDAAVAYSLMIKKISTACTFSVLKRYDCARSHRHQASVSNSTTMQAQSA